MYLPRFLTILATVASTVYTSPIQRQAEIQGRDYASSTLVEAPSRVKRAPVELYSAGGDASARLDPELEESATVVEAPTRVKRAPVELYSAGGNASARLDSELEE